MAKMNVFPFASGNEEARQEDLESLQKKKSLKDIRNLQILNKIRKQHSERSSTEPFNANTTIQNLKVIINSQKEKVKPTGTNTILELNIERKKSFIKIDPIKVQTRCSSQKNIKCIANKDEEGNEKVKLTKISLNSSFVDEHRSKRHTNKAIPYKETIFGTPLTQKKKERLKDLIIIPRSPLIAPPPNISSKSWIILNGRTNKPLWGSKQFKVREIASLTKIMTANVVLQISTRLNIQKEKFVMRVSKIAASIGGTSALLQEGDKLTVRDLLYGLMLPSGNDAAYVLAENFGVFLYLEAYSKTEKLNSIIESCYLDVSEESKICKTPVVYFVEQMNKTTKEMNMFHTVYCNPHGLINRVNRSTAMDIAQLSQKCMQIDFFRTIVASKRYSCTVRTLDGSEKKMTWVRFILISRGVVGERRHSAIREQHGNYKINFFFYHEKINTNKLLDFGFEGIKTGYTETAGPCLAASYRRRGPFVGRNLIVIIVLLASKTSDHRWDECNALVKWVFANLSEQL